VSPKHKTSHKKSVQDVLDESVSPEEEAREEEGETEECPGDNVGYGDGFDVECFCAPVYKENETFDRLFGRDGEGRQVRNVSPSENERQDHNESR
jgi:hypothetical protein